MWPEYEEKTWTALKQEYEQRGINLMISKRNAFPVPDAPDYRGIIKDAKDSCFDEKDWRV